MTNYQSGDWVLLKKKFHRAPWYNKLYSAQIVRLTTNLTNNFKKTFKLKEDVLFAETINKRIIVLTLDMIKRKAKPEEVLREVL